MSRAMRKLSSSAGAHNTTLIFTNQVRDKIGVIYGAHDTTPGGRALKFYASIRIKLQRISYQKEVVSKTEQKVVGSVVRAYIEKNKVSPPCKTAEFTITYGKGIDRLLESIDIGLSKRIIIKSGAWLELFGEKYQGRNNLMIALKQNPDILQELDDNIEKALNETVIVETDNLGKESKKEDNNEAVEESKEEDVHVETV